MFPFAGSDYRDGSKAKVMTLAAGEFIRRFLMHTLPDGFHRIRHFGLFANGHRADKLKLCRLLLATPTPDVKAEGTNPKDTYSAEDEHHACPCCGGRMIVIETFDGPYTTKSQAPNVRRFDSS